MNVPRMAVSALVALVVLTAACRKSETAKQDAHQASAIPAASTPLPPACNGGTGCPGSACLTSITSAAATVPADACPQFGEFQSAVDIFSWNSFVALNWPAARNCAADTSKTILDVKSGTHGPVVWQTQMASEGVFVAPNRQPQAWCQGEELAALFSGAPRPMKNIAKAHSAAHLLGGAFPQIAEPTGVTAVGGVVTDQSGRWLRFEKYMNQTEYTAIVENDWYRLATLNNLPSITLPTGSLEVKAAWKVLTPQEIESNRYYTTVATVYNTPDDAPSPGPNPVTLGLVGLHIIQKTPSQSGFFWSTFEQVDNDATFLNPTGPTNYNQQTASKPYVELQPNGQPNNQPVQIKRDTAIPADPTLNAYYRSLLGDSVFKYYRLISTQWQTGGAPQGTPANVANIVIETYVQNASTPLDKTKPNGTQVTGCLACHLNATAANKTTSTDHSFLFLAAQ